MNSEQELNLIKNRIGLVSGRLTIKEYDDAAENVSAHIDPRDWGIEITLKTGYNPIQDRRQKAYARKKKIQDGKQKLLEDILYHELGHWQLPFGTNLGCPFDSYYHDKITEAVKEALPTDRKMNASYTANAFEDLLVNTRAREFTGSFAGQVLFFDEQGVKINQKYTPIYEAFVKLNMVAWGDKADSALVKRHYKNSDEVQTAVKEISQAFGLEDKSRLTKRLFRKEEWKRMAGSFAKAMAPLLETAPIERLSAYRGNVEERQKSQGSSGNGIEQKAASREGKEEISYGRYSNGESQSPNIQNLEQLDLLYRKLAKSISVKVESMSKEQGMTIAPLNYRPFNPEKDDIRKAKLTKLFAADGGITVGYQKEPLTVTQKSKIQRKSFPDFKMVLMDNSGSMRLNPQNQHNGVGNPVNIGKTSFIPWGDNSKYHYALLGLYGIENFLQQQGVAQYINHGLSLFSDSTRYREASFTDIQELRKLALSPEFGNTALDAKVLIEALKGRESFVLSISDGEIGNWEAAKNDFEKLAANNHFAHIQLGGKNSFTNDLEQGGFPVFYVNSGDELSKLMVDVASKTYRRFTHEKRQT